VGALLTFCFVDASGSAVGEAGGALVTGAGVGAFVGYASLLGPGVLLLATLVLAGIAVSGEGLRSLVQVARHTPRRTSWTP
jgi:hypothetical protein